MDNSEEEEEEYNQGYPEEVEDIDDDEFEVSWFISSIKSHCPFLMQVDIGFFSFVLQV